MPELMFEERFEPRILSGQKRHTIRPCGARNYLPGDFLSLRRWEGVPFRAGSRKKLIKATECTGVEIIVITQLDILKRAANRWQPISAHDREKLAVDDGFDSWDEMRAWFTDNHGLPFRGRLIHWRV